METYVIIWILLVVLTGVFTFLLFLPVKVSISAPVFKASVSYAGYTLYSFPPGKKKEKKTAVKPEKAKASKTPPLKPKPAKTKAKKKKPKLKDLLPLLRDPLLIYALKKEYRLVRRLLKSIRLGRLEWDISLSDFYHQGLLDSLIATLPKHKRVCIKGNYLGKNSFELNLKSNVLKLLAGVILLVLSQPWLTFFKIFKSYFRQNKTRLNPSQ